MFKSNVYLEIRRQFYADFMYFQFQIGSYERLRKLELHDNLLCTFS